MEKYIYTVNISYDLNPDCLRQVPLVHIARLGPEALVTSFRADMAGHLKKAKKEAMKACDGKTHILNESEPVVEAVKDMHSKLKTFDNMSECTHARLICILAEALADFELEGKNEDFSGDEVLCELDKEMLGLLGSIRSKGNVDDVDNTWRPVLGQIAKLFTCSTYKRFQAYGLFEFDGMCLQSGEVAATMLAR